MSEVAFLSGALWHGRVSVVCSASSAPKKRRVSLSRAMGYRHDEPVRELPRSRGDSSRLGRACFLFGSSTSDGARANGGGWRGGESRREAVETPVLKLGNRAPEREHEACARLFFG